MLLGECLEETWTPLITVDMINGNRKIRFVLVQIRELRQFFHVALVPLFACEVQVPMSIRTFPAPPFPPPPLNEAQICEKRRHKEIIIELVVSHYRFDSE